MVGSSSASGKMSLKRSICSRERESESEFKQPSICTSLSQSQKSLRTMFIISEDFVVLGCPYCNIRLVICMKQNSFVVPFGIPCKASCIKGELFLSTEWIQDRLTVHLAILHRTTFCQKLHHNLLSLKCSYRAPLLSDDSIQSLKI